MVSVLIYPDYFQLRKFVPILPCFITFQVMTTKMRNMDGTEMRAMKVGMKVDSFQFPSHFKAYLKTSHRDNMRKVQFMNSIVSFMDHNLYYTICMYGQR